MQMKSVGIFFSYQKITLSTRDLIKNEKRKLNEKLSKIIRNEIILISDIPADDILELFGKTFFEFCQDSGYDKILQVLGASPRDFLQVSFNLNCLKKTTNFHVTGKCWKIEMSVMNAHF